ncbi:MAG: histone deacetylase family protein, partial [Halobacteriota archaeon]
GADDAMGFCFVNNVAVAAEGVLAKGRADRVGIVDWDAHHANGTQQYVTDQPDAALVSLHQAGLYPGTGRLEATDTDRVVNVALPADLGDAAYLEAFDRTVVPAMSAFDPDVVLVSCGFDPHAKDVLASQRLTADGFGLLAGAVCELADALDAGVGVVLEGGYSLDVIGDCAVAMAEAFAGDVPPRPAYTTNRQLEAVIAEVERHPLVGSG